jgi:hypothetical protein
MISYEDEEFYRYLKPEAVQELKEYARCVYFVKEDNSINALCN